MRNGIIRTRIRELSYVRPTRNLQIIALSTVGGHDRMLNLPMRSR